VTEGLLRGCAATNFAWLLFPCCLGDACDAGGPSWPQLGLKRFFLHFKGISGDKRGGIRQLEIAATRGRYLRPFAKILLALAALRKKKTALARIQLMELVAEFPQNPLFARELAKFDASPDVAVPL
jgi:hypothetical protein